MDSKLTGIGKDIIKANNVSAILSCIYRSGPISRRDIAKAVHLTPSTVTLLITELLQCGLLQEGEQIDEMRAGRKMVQIDFNPDYGFVLGVCIEPTTLSFALSPLSFRRLGEQRIVHKIPNTYGAHELLPALLAHCERFMQGHTLAGRFCAIGLSLSGHVDPVNGIGINSYGVLPAQTAVAAAFERHFHVPAFLDNNVRSLAQAELGLRRAIDADSQINGLFIKHDPGFGCTVLLKGEVYEGASFSSGEIGHACVVRGGRHCICGKTGCLSTVVSTDALRSAASQAFGPSTTPALWQLCSGMADCIDIRSLVKSAAQGDPPIVTLLREAASAMASAIETSLLLLDGDTVIPFGAIFEEEWFFDLLREVLRESFGDFRQLDISRSRLSDGDRWKGSVCTALHNYIHVVKSEFSQRKEQ